jgi:hypothetical protein
MCKETVSLFNVPSFLEVSQIKAKIGRKNVRVHKDENVYDVSAWNPVSDATTYITRKSDFWSRFYESRLFGLNSNTKFNSAHILALT